MRGMEEIITCWLKRGCKVLKNYW